MNYKDHYHKICSKQKIQSGGVSYAGHDSIHNIRMGVNPGQRCRYITGEVQGSHQAPQALKIAKSFYLREVVWWIGVVEWCGVVWRNGVEWFVYKDVTSFNVTYKLYFEKDVSLVR